MFLNLPQLLAQNELALALVHLRLGFLADLARQPQHLDALTEVPQHLIQALLDVERLKDVLAFRRLQIHEAGHQIGQHGCGRDVLNRADQLRLRLRQQLNRLLGPLAQLVGAGGDLGRRSLFVGDELDPRDEIRLALQKLQDAEALHALADDMVGPVGRGEVPQQVRDGAYPVEVLRPRRLDRRVALQDHPERQLLASRFLRRRDRIAATDDERQDDAREQHQVAYRQEDHLVIGEFVHDCCPFCPARGLNCRIKIAGAWPMSFNPVW